MIERSRLTPCKTAQRQSFCGEAPTSNLTSVTTVDLIFSPFILHLVFNQYSALVIATGNHATQANILTAEPECCGGQRWRGTRAENLNTVGQYNTSDQFRKF